MVRERSPSAIILDLSLPGLDGFQLLDLIRQDSLLAKIPVIIVSGRSVSVAEHEAITSAGCAYFMKGEFSPRKIATTLRAAIAA